MEKIIYFEEKPGSYGVLRFVADYQRKRFLRKAKVQYTLDVESANYQLSYNEGDFEEIRSIIKKDYPDARVCIADIDTFKGTHSTNRFWVICTWIKPGKIGYYCDNDRNYKAKYTEDLPDVRMMLAETAAKETLRNIQRSTRDRVWVQEVYLNLINELLTPILMIMCTNRKTDETKYFARIEENRVRLVNTSEGATKYPYEEVLRMFEFLRTHNKNYLYTVMPAFKDNVNYRDFEAYVKVNNISRMIAMDLKLKHLFRTETLKNET